VPVDAMRDWRGTFIEKPKFPSLFGPIHGSGFDVAGNRIANPIGTLWSAAMMLEHRGQRPATDRLMRVVERVAADPSLHPAGSRRNAIARRVTDTVVRAIWWD